MRVNAVDTTSVRSHEPPRNSVSDEDAPHRSSAQRRLLSAALLAVVTSLASLAASALAGGADIYFAVAIGLAISTAWYVAGRKPDGSS